MLSWDKIMHTCLPTGFFGAGMSSCHASVICDNGFFFPLFTMSGRSAALARCRSPARPGGHVFVCVGVVIKGHVMLLPYGICRYVLQ